MTMAFYVQKSMKVREFTISGDFETPSQLNIPSYRSRHAR
jgi:hypothetical protein